MSTQKAPSIIIIYVIMLVSIARLYSLCSCTGMCVSVMHGVSLRELATKYYHSMLRKQSSLKCIYRARYVATIWIYSITFTKLMGMIAVVLVVVGVACFFCLHLLGMFYPFVSNL